MRQRTLATRQIGPVAWLPPFARLVEPCVGRSALRAGVPIANAGYTNVFQCCAAPSAGWRSRCCTLPTGITRAGERDSALVRVWSEDERHLSAQRVTCERHQRGTSPEDQEGDSRAFRLRECGGGKRSTEHRQSGVSLSGPDGNRHRRVQVRYHRLADGLVDTKSNSARFCNGHDCQVELAHVVTRREDPLPRGLPR